MMVSAAHAGSVNVVDQAGTPVPDAIVLLPGTVATTGNYEAVIDQVGKRFTPYVSLVTSGTWIRFPNSDDTRHSVYSFSDAKTFELKLYHANDADPILFDKPGLVALGCNVHDHMKAYVLVIDQAGRITDSNGQVEFDSDTNVLEGVTNLDVWHPQLTDPTPVALTLDNGILVLPFIWNSEDPQAAKSRTALENKFKSFKRDAN